VIEKNREDTSLARQSQRSDVSTTPGRWAHRSREKDFKPKRKRKIHIRNRGLMGCSERHSDRMGTERQRRLSEGTVGMAEEATMAKRGENGMANSESPEKA